MERLIGTLLCICLFVCSATLAGTWSSSDFPPSTYEMPRQSVASSIAYELLIITPVKWKEGFEPLREHKESHGIRTMIVGLDDIFDGVYFSAKGRDDAEQIKYFIKDAKENWSIRYVMLVGGRNEMPVRYSVVHSDFLDDFISDLYYADIYDINGSFCSWDSNNNGMFGEVNDTSIIDEVDLHPDVYVGRILCSDSTEVETVVRKIIEYENNAFGKPWFKNLILCGGDTHPNIWLELLFPLLIEYDCRIAWEGEYLCNTVTNCMDEFNAKRLYASGLIRLQAKRLTKMNVNQAINEGAGFWLFAGHGSPSSYATHPPFCKRIWIPYFSGYKSSDIQNLRNGDKLPVAVFCACSCGDFNATSSPIAWEVVKHSEGGAIASFACTTLAYDPVTTLCTETFNGHAAVGVFKSYSEGKDIIGDIWADTIVNYLNDEDAWSFIKHSGAVWNNHVTLEEWILLGDPSLKIGGYP